MIYTTPQETQTHLNQLFDQVIEQQEIVIVNRQNQQNVALIAADELDSLLETAHLLRSPKNAQRLLTALERAKNKQGEVQTLEQLKQEVGID